MSRLVTDHAVQRYLERFRGIDVAAIRDRLGPRASDCQVAEVAARCAGTTAAAVRALVCPPDLEPAVRAGALSIRRDGYTLACWHGVVTTIVLGRIRRESRSMRQRALGRCRDRGRAPVTLRQAEEEAWS